MLATETWHSLHRTCLEPLGAPAGLLARLALASKPVAEGREQAKCTTTRLQQGSAVGVGLAFVL